MPPLTIALYGSSLLSSYWNGAATYYRGLCRALAARGHRIVFLEPDAFDRQAHRDLVDAPDYARVVVWAADQAGLAYALQHAADADVVVKASGVGVHDDALLLGLFGPDGAAPLQALRVFWDVDAPATLAALGQGREPTLGALLPGLDLVLTYGGGPPVVAAYRRAGARDCVPIYNALDPDTHFPVAPDPRFACDLAFLGNRLPDREARVDQFFVAAAQAAPELEFLIAGSGWADKPMPDNVRVLGHVGTADHNAFNTTPRAVLNIARADMAAIGYSPATRIFEAAGAGACIISDSWPGIDTFLEPWQEILLARDGAEVATLLRQLTGGAARAIGNAALARVLGDHTYDQRAVLVEQALAAARTARDDTAAPPARAAAQSGCRA